MTLFSPPDDDEIRFAEETESVQPEKSWKILIVDDDAEVHHVTRLALRDFTFADRALAFISAYSAREAQQFLQAQPDIAIVLLDVVMESENAGLQLVKFIREDLKNSLVRIILRTGQPGQAPEGFVAMHYGIDDYKTKTELTAQKLSTAVVTALRAFATLISLLDLSRDLETKIIQQKQTELDLRLSEMAAIAKVQDLERYLLHQQQAQLPASPVAGLEQLEQLPPAITPDPLPLTPPTNALQTLSIITRIARSVLRITDEQAAKLGISQTKLAALVYLSGEPQQSASPSAIAKHCQVSRAAVTGLLDGLEQETYVERDSHPSDRRALMVKLTAKGQQFLNLIALPEPNQQLPELLGALSAADRQQVNGLLARFSQLFKIE